MRSMVEQFLRLIIKQFVLNLHLLSLIIKQFPNNLHMLNLFLKQLLNCLGLLDCNQKLNAPSVLPSLHFLVLSGLVMHNVAFMPALASHLTGMRQSTGMGDLHSGLTGVTQKGFSGSMASWPPISPGKTG